MQLDRYGSIVVLAAATIAGAVSARANLIGRWTFNELGGSTAHDVSGVGSAADGTLIDGATIGGDGYLTLDGTTGYVNFGHPSKLTAIPNGFTIEAWVLNVDTPVQGHEPLIFGQDTTAFGMTMYRNTFDGYANGGANSTDATYFNPATPMLVTVTYDQSSKVISIYRNGIFSNSRTLTLSSFDASSSLDLLTGTSLDKTQFLSGKIDEISFYDSGLSDTQVAANYSVGPAPSAPVWVAQAGDWSSPSNWGGVIPNGVDAVANFGSSITAARTVYADAPVTVGAINFQNSNSYVLAGASSLTINVSTGSGAINVLQGSHRINLPLFVTDNTVADVAPGSTLTIGNPLTLVGGSTLTKTGAGTLSIEAPVKSAAAGTLSVQGGVVNSLMDLGTNTSVATTGGTTNFKATQHLNALSVNGGIVSVGSDGNVVVTTKALSFTGAGQLDLNRSKIIVDYTGASTLANVKAAVAAGSLTSSQLAAGRAIGVGEASDLFSSFPASFAGESIDATSVLVAYTITADASLDGTVNSADFNLLAASYGKLSSARWTQGDFNGDGKVNTVDFNLLAGNFGSSLPPSAPTLGSVVPEPSTLSIVAIGIASLLASRKRR